MARIPRLQRLNQAQREAVIDRLERLTGLPYLMLAPVMIPLFAGPPAGGNLHLAAATPYSSHEPTVFECDGAGEGDDVTEVDFRCQTGPLTHRITAGGPVCATG